MEEEGENTGRQDETDPSPIPRDSAISPDETIHILYIDDDADMALFFQTYMKKMGTFEVYLVPNGREAIRLLEKKHPYDVIVSDYHMPGMDGIELLKSSRTLPSAPPFILFTGKGREEVVMEAINNGAAFYLQKGGDTHTLFAELAHKIRQAVGNQRTETALRESEEKFRLLFESARDAILIIKNGRIADSNRQASVFFRAGHGDLVGLTMNDLSPEVQPDDSVSENKWDELTSMVLAGSYEFMVWRYRRMDGTLFDAEASLNHIDLDRTPCVQVVLRDITERIKAEQDLSNRNIELSAAYQELMAAEEERKFHLSELISKQERLEESEQKYRELTDLLPQVVFETDTRGRITYANRQAFSTFGYTPTSLPANLQVIDIIVPEDRQRAFKNLSLILKGEKTTPNEYMVIKKDGTTFPAIVHSVPIIRNGEYQGMRGIAIDITERKKYEEALIRSEEKYRTLVDHIQDGVFIIQEGRLQFANPAFAMTLGYRIDEISGEMMEKFIAPEDREMVIDRHFKRMNGEEVPTQYEFRMIKADGETRVLVNMDIGVITFQGKQASIGTIRDVTKERQAEEALRESERRLSDVINFLPDATFVIDREGKVIAWNRAMEQLTGVAAGEMLGQGDYAYSFPFYGEKRQILVDLALKPDEGINDKYMSISWSGDVLIGEAWMPDMDGRPLFLWGAATPLRDSRGTIIGAIESIRDITERKHTEEALVQATEELEQRVARRTAELTDVNAALVSEVKERRLAEAALRESEERYRKLIELSPDAVFVHDGTEILFVNQAGAHLLGAGNVEDIVGLKVVDLFHPDSTDKIQSHIDHARYDEPGDRTMEELFVRSDGTPVDVEVSSARIIFQGLPAILVVARDITGRKKAAEQLRQYAEEMANKNKELDYLANQLIDMNQELDKRVRERTEQVITLMKQKDMFITQLGHDLKTPLTPIRAMLPILIEEEKNPEIREAMRILLRSALSIQDQTEKILTIARLTRNDIRIIPEPVAIYSCISESVDKHRLTIEQKHISVTIDIPKDLVVQFSLADGGTVFENIIGNAIKYTSEGGTILIGNRPGENMTCIYIQDDGIGLTPEEAAHVFDEFYMVDPSRHDRSSSGLGLSIVRRLVSLYGGNVKVESEGKGKGATFSVCLPDSRNPPVVP